MAALPSDVNIKARWVAPMRVDGAMLEHHTLVVRDGRILDVLPHEIAAARYLPSVELDRPAHLALPGLVNARTRIAPLPGVSTGAPFWVEGALLSIANLLRAGVTTFCEVGLFPRDVAALAVAQGLRAVIGLPVSERPSVWAQEPTGYFRRANELHDEYRGHASISTRFAPLRPGSLGDETLARLATLAAEIDSGVLAALHESEAEVQESMRRHGRRPLERLHEHGLVTPALTAAHMTALDQRDLELVHRSGLAVTLCPASGLMRGHGMSPLAALQASRADAAPAQAAPLRLSLGSDGEYCGPSQDLWSQIRLLGLHSPPHGAARALAAASRGGAEALGLDSQIGTLEAGKWADVCCLDLSAPELQLVHDPLRQLAQAGTRELVSDVWVAGRHLLVEGRLTRLDWPQLAARLAERPPPAPSTLPSLHL
jgi:5-methylthioadenosine/S-adenosylhomocysteine deaminase